jgi:pyruvate,water dikinase
MDNIIWFKDIKKEDVISTGGKGASLGEMYNIPLPVPPGFVISTNAFKRFIIETKISDRIFSALTEIKADETEKIQETSKQIQELIIKTKIPIDIETEIREAYDNLNVDPSIQKSINGTALNLVKSGRDIPAVAIRSSATAEDSPEASFAGQQETYLNIKGTDNVIKAVQYCWASLYTPRAIYYRIKNNFDHSKVLLAVVVQKMIHSDVSGIMFTINPSNNCNEIMIEAIFGLGDAVVGGEVSPDTYTIDKTTGEIKTKKVSIQKWLYDKKALGGKTKLELTEELGSKQKLTDEGIKKLAQIGKRIEEHYNMPMDIEWAVELNKLYIVQARPITTIKKIEEIKTKEITGNILLQGLGASPGIASGKVKIIHNPKEITKIEQGDILVAVMTSPDYVPAMERASAIVTDEGGITAHSAIVSRELGIPCIVGTEKATSILKEGEVITIDGHKGIIYKGNVILEKTKPTEKIEEINYSNENLQELTTKTKIYMNLSEPEKIKQYKNLPFDGIGLMRIEFIISSWIKKHPLYMINIGKENEYIEKLAEGISIVASELNPKQVIVRFSDFKTNEYKNLEGGEKYEPHEDNPLLGWRGVSRYISPEFEKAFRLECKAIKKVRETFENVYVMLPFVRTTWEVKKCINILSEEGLERNENFKIYCMVEVPSVILCLEDFCEYFDGFSIGSNDLSMLILGVDRDSGKLGKMGYFDENNPAILKAIKEVIEIAHANEKTVSLCGQAPSSNKEFAGFLVKCRIDSISINPDIIIETKKFIHFVEKILDR